jgi:hypothetical protein
MFSKDSCGGKYISNAGFEVITAIVLKSSIFHRKSINISEESFDFILMKVEEQVEKKHVVSESLIASCFHAEDGVCVFLRNVGLLLRTNGVIFQKIDVFQA